MDYASRCQGQESWEGGCHDSRDSCRVPKPSDLTSQGSIPVTGDIVYILVTCGTLYPALLGSSAEASELSMAKAIWSLSSNVPQGLWKHHTPRKHMLKILDMCSCQNFKRSFNNWTENFRRVNWSFKLPQEHSAALMECPAAFLECLYNHFLWRCVSCACSYPLLFMCLLYGYLMVTY